MKTAFVVLLVFGLNLLPAGLASAGHIPSHFQVRFPTGDTSVLRTELNGAGTYEGLGATWTVSDFAAQIVFDGSFVSTMSVPGFNLIWYFTGETLPLSVDVVSNTGGEYHIIPTVLATNDPNETQDTSAAQVYLTGNTYYGQYFPDVYMVNLYISLENPHTVYDLTVNLEWGTGVANETLTWDKVKCLYR